MKNIIEKYEKKIQQLKRASYEDPTGIIAQRIADFKEFINDLSTNFKIQDVCVYIENEEQLEQMREFLLSKCELIDNGAFFITNDHFDYNYLQYSCFDNKFFLSVKSQDQTIITIEQFKKLWK